ncbi:DinB family protein [Chitinophaga sp. Mgbs1]|uniref:DinB family protein n=1 Tax=Chitinophaga solisilvae TaxID=1233460 RepID=A0A3S1B0X4_9BACT|nr:DinB family protein [Chitinophaga solisilvae]
MTDTTLQRLDWLCQTIPPLLEAIGEEAFAFKPMPAKWSKKEILGHLIDSATNNHQRFVRAQFEDTPAIGYNQNDWNKYSYYHQIDSTQLIRFWTSYNMQLLALLHQMPPHMFDRTCYAGSPEQVTLSFVATDYVAHLEHHLRQLVDY